MVIHIFNLGVIMRLVKFLVLIVLLVLSQPSTAKLFGVDLKNILSDNNITLNFGSKQQDYSKYRYESEDDVEFIPEGGAHSSIHDDESLRVLAYEYSENNQDYKAIETYEESLNLNRKNIKTWHGYCWSLLKLKRHNEAGKACGKSLNLGNNSQTWWLLGWNYEKQKNNKYAIKCYDEALKINPKNKKAVYAYFDLKKRMFNDYKKNSLYKVKTKSSTLTVREYPEARATKRGSLKKGDIINLVKKSSEKVTIEGKSGYWVLIKKGSMTGYVFSAYLSRVNSKKEKTEHVKSQSHNPKFTVQAGSFSSNKAALNFSKKFSNEEIFIIPNASTNRHLVTIGSFATREAAKKYIPSLKKRFPSIGFFFKQLD